MPPIAENPRDHNRQADYAQGTAERLAMDYAELVANVERLLETSASLPATVEASEDIASISAHVVRLRDARGRVLAQHKDEKEPFLRGGEAVDAFFFSLRDNVTRDERELKARVDRFKQRQLAEERRRREEAAAEARRVEAQAAALRAEAEAAARRARNADSIRQRQLEAEYARVEESLAQRETEAAELAALAKPSAMVSERFEGPERSGQVTMKKVPFVMIEDAALLDLERLRPYFKDEHLQFALRAWAKATAYAETMPGAIAEMRDTTVVR